MDRFTWIVVGGVLGLVAIGLAAAAMLRGHEVPPDLSTPSGVVLAYALAEQRKDPQTAWDLLAPSAQARVDHDRFVALIGSRGGADREYLTTESERITGDSATVVLVHTYVGSGGLFGTSSYTNRNSVSLSRLGVDWRITIPPADDYLFFTLTKP